MSQLFIAASKTSSSISIGIHVAYTLGTYLIFVSLFQLDLGYKVNRSASRCYSGHPLMGGAYTRKVAYYLHITLIFNSTNYSYVSRMIVTFHTLTKQRNLLITIRIYFRNFIDQITTQTKSDIARALVISLHAMGADDVILLQTLVSKPSLRVPRRASSSSGM